MNRKCYPGLWEGVRHRAKQHYERMRVENRAAEIAKSKKLVSERGIAFVPKDGDNFTFICWGKLTDLKLWEKRA